MATKYFRNITGAWTTNSSWSLASGGASTGTFSTSVPTSSDDAIFDNNSGTCSVASANHSTKTVNFTGYTHTITLTGNIQVFGNITMGSNMILAGSGQIVIAATSTVTTNAKVINVPVTIGDGSSAYTVTFADNCTCSKYLLLQPGSPTILNGNKLIALQDFKVAFGDEVQGTTELQFNGTNTITMSGVSMNIDTTLAGTISTSLLQFGTVLGDTRICTIKYTSGTIAADLYLASKCNLNTYGITWNDVNFGDAILVSTFSANTISLLNPVSGGILGTYGFTCSNLYLGIQNTVILNSGVTYSTQNIYSSGIYNNGNGYITSSIPGSQAYLNLGTSSYGNIIYTDVTDIKSVGAGAYTFNGVLTNATNWISLGTSRTVAHVFI